MECVGHGVPKVHWAGNSEGKNMIVMELLGNTLQSYLEKQNYKFSLKTTLMLFIQILHRVENLHKNGYIHRNIRPENFTMGLNENLSTCYMIDYVLAKKYFKDGEIIPFKKGRKMTGSLRFASVNSQLGFEQSRRDDLESIGYMMISFYKGQLPWEDVTASNKDEKFSMVLKSKISVTALLKGLPVEIVDYMNYVKCMEYGSEPDYENLRGMLKQLYINKGYSEDGKFDWDESEVIDKNYNR